MEGFYNVDISDSSRADGVMDLLKPNWAIPSDVFELVICNHFVEHIPREKLPVFMNEVYRTCKDGAVIQIEAPHWSSDNFHTDPTHCLPISERTFDFFDKRKPLGENGRLYGWLDGMDFEVLSSKLIPNPPNGPDVKIVLQVHK